MVDVPARILPNFVLTTMLVIILALIGAPGFTNAGSGRAGGPGGRCAPNLGGIVPMRHVAHVCQISLQTRCNNCRGFLNK